MPRKTKKTRIKCEFFVWLLGQRDGVFYADGRANQPPLGRHSLGTRDRGRAENALRQLDHVKAVELGRVKETRSEINDDDPLSLQDGWQMYFDHVSRPRVTGGAKPTTLKRYRAVWDKFAAFAQGRQVASWNEVTEDTLTAYAAWLEKKEYAYATQYLELTTLKQAIKWLAACGRIKLPRISLRIAKPRETETYCWRPEEVDAILSFCKDNGGLSWLGNVCLTLAGTGLRISELAALRWSDIDWDNNVIRLTDESTYPKRSGVQKRQTKTGHSRSFPMHVDIRRLLESIERTSDGLVFHGPRGGRIKPDTTRRILTEKVLAKLVDRFPTVGGARGFQDGRLHSFRHYFCSMCANRGIPELVVMNWLGHRSSDMVRRYYHLHDREAQQHMERLTIVMTKQAAG